ncbi:YciI family protein [Pendulispora rubella]|uniref:YciI family protein n=1 Tax=Pendulispora rubella TaxID=2741070 RepID=A0ABZ2KXT3_9BACT
MFILISEYLKPVDEVDRFYAQHAAFLAKHYGSGRVLGSGRRNPPSGGIILAKGESRREIEEIFREDPFVMNDCARYSIFEFNPNPPPRRQPQLDDWLNAPVSGDEGGQSKGANDGDR